MQVAQRLYEQGWITYHRTDGVAVAAEAQTAAREVILRTYGQDYLPPTAPGYAPQAVHAQEAHEAIRPTDPTRMPEREPVGAGAQLYGLIWRRFIASQMSPARYMLRAALIHVGKVKAKPFPLVLKAQGRELIFDGFLRVYEEPEEDDGAKSDAPPLPALKEGQALDLVELRVDAVETRPPSRFSEAGLVQALERHGVGRPSTYASMVKVIQDKQYVTLRQKRLVPSETGRQLCAFLLERFPQVFDVGYSARLEAALDEIARGQLKQQVALASFWSDFQPQLKSASEYALGQVRARSAPKPLLLRAVED